MEPRILFDNSYAHLVDVPPPYIEALRYDLAYDSGAPSQSPTMDEAGVLRPGWDGWYRLLTLQGKMPAGLVGRARRLLHKYGLRVRVIDHREAPEQQIPRWSSGLPKARGYQNELVDAALSASRGVIDSPPRSGKTLMGAMFVDRVNMPFLWIAPTRGIVKQTVEVLEQYFGERPAALMGGGSQSKKMRMRAEAMTARIVVTTEATAVKLPVRFWSTRAGLVYDEFHHSASDRGQEINRLAKSIYFRLGLTGTHFRSDANTEILMHGVLSHVIGKVPVQRLVDEGYLCPADVLTIPIYWPYFPGSNTTELYPLAIVQHEERNRWICWAASTLAASGRRTIVLVQRLEHGELLEAGIPGSVFINGNDGDAAARGIKDFNGGKIPVLIGTSVLGEGIDLPAADAVVYAKAGRAAVTTTQDVYRVLTAHAGKTRAIIVDFADRHCMPFLNQSVARAQIYGSESSWSVSVLQDPVSELPRRILATRSL